MEFDQFWFNFKAKGKQVDGGALFLFYKIDDLKSGWNLGTCETFHGENFVIMIAGSLYIIGIFTIKLLKNILDFKGNYVGLILFVIYTISCSGKFKSKISCDFFGISHGKSKQAVMISIYHKIAIRSYILVACKGFLVIKVLCEAYLYDLNQPGAESISFSGKAVYAAHTFHFVGCLRIIIIYISI